MEQKFYSTSQVAQAAKVKMHQLAYAITNGSIPDTTIRFLDKRLFTENEMKNIVAYFDGLRTERKECQNDA